MANATEVMKPTLAEVAKQLSADNPDIFNCDHERELFEGDFQLLVRSFVTDSNGSFHEFQPIKERCFKEVLARAATMKFDIKARAAGHSSLLKLAEECAVGKGQKAIDKEATEELKGFNVSSGQRQELLKVAMDKMSKKM